MQYGKVGIIVKVAHLHNAQNCPSIMQMSACGSRYNFQCYISNDIEWNKKYVLQENVRKFEVVLGMAKIPQSFKWRI